MNTDMIYSMKKRSRWNAAHHALDEPFPLGDPTEVEHDPGCVMPSVFELQKRIAQVRSDWSDEERDRRTASAYRNGEVLLEPVTIVV